MRMKVIAALACIFVLTVAAYFAAGQSDSPRILRPLDKSVVPSGLVEIAVIVPSGTEPPPIVLDGRKLKLPSPQSSGEEKDSASRQSSDVFFLPPAVVVVRSLPPGLHRLSAGETSVEFFVRDEKGKESPPRGWSRYIAHPPAGSGGVTCAACHELSEKRRFLNMNSVFSLEKPLGCFDCHERPEFNLTHNHRYESLAFCQMCHDPHGATGDHLLRIPEKKACALCHD